MSLFAQIRNRRLFQVVASYVAAGWVMLQVIDQLVNRSMIPNVIYELTLLAYLCGLPAAFVIGWYHGEKGEQRTPRSELLILSLLGVVFLSLSSFSVRDYRTERMVREAALSDAGLDLRRIGVMYFTDYTRDGQNQHVADALTEAIIDELTRVPALDVTTRNAASHFRASTLPRDSIARILGVGTLLDGIVEERGGQLHITVRLFEGHNGREFRSATFRTTPEEMLTARDRLVDDVAHMLRQWLGEEVRVRTGGLRVTNPEAWTLYQRAEKVRKDAEDLVAAHDVDAAFAAFASADSLAAQSTVLAREWVEPIVLQANTAYRRSREAHDRHEILSWIDRALEHAESALRLEPNHARALDLRGTARYWKYLNVQDHDPDAAQRLLIDARRDLEEAVRIDPLLASAHSTLGHLLTREDMASAVLATRRAYEADAYLEVAADVLLRLVLGNYDLENFDQMQRWCAEGVSRFPDNFRFTDCQLLLMTTRQVAPDVDVAWALLESLDSLSPSHRQQYDRARGTMLVGGVIARAAQQAPDRMAMTDSARNVLAHARRQLTHEADPRQELLQVLAYMYLLLDDNATAIDLLRRYAAVNPHASYEHHWRWRELRGLPEFQPLLVEDH